LRGKNRNKTGLNREIIEPYPKIYFQPFPALHFASARFSKQPNLPVWLQNIRAMPQTGKPTALFLSGCIERCFRLTLSESPAHHISLPLPNRVA
jgi:hypothetical protein